MDEAQAPELSPPPLPSHIDEPGKTALSEFVNQILYADAFGEILLTKFRDSYSGMTWAERAAIEAGQAGNRTPFDQLLARRKPLSTTMRKFILESLFPVQSRRVRPLNRNMRDLKAVWSSPNTIWAVYSDETKCRRVISFSSEELKDRVVILVLVASDYRNIMRLFQQKYKSSYGRQYLAAEMACRRWDFRDETGTWNVNGVLKYIARGKKSSPA